MLFLSVGVVGVGSVVVGRCIVAFNVTGKTGSVRVEVLPGPRGLGLVAGEIPKQVLRLAGVRDCWTRTFGSTSTLSSSALAVFDALTQTYNVVTQSDWVN